MLIQCPECELQVSDKAVSCPHCGYPISSVQAVPASSKPYRKKPKHMRLPNGFGQISYINDHNLRKPYRAMVTVGKDCNGRPICKMLKPQSYFETYNEAYAALVEYNKNPYDLDSDITVKELYERWTDAYFKTLKSDSSQRTIKSAWSRCEDLYNMRVVDVRARHIKGVINKEGVSLGIQFRIKSLFNKMLDYALEYEIVEKNVARTFGLSDEVIADSHTAKKDHIRFTDEELEILWKNQGNQFVDMVLIQCYSGWRPQELVLLKRENINLEEMTMIGGMKTEAGTDRVVPIHSAIYELVKKYYELSESRGCLFIDRDGSALTYDRMYKRFKTMLKDLDISDEHRPHDGRKTFVSLAKSADMNEYAIKRIVGHTISDITEDKYTDRDSNWLKTEIEKILVSHT